MFKNLLMHKKERVLSFDRTLLPFFLWFLFAEHLFFCMISIARVADLGIGTPQGDLVIAEGEGKLRHAGLLSAVSVRRFVVVRNLAPKSAKVNRECVQDLRKNKMMYCAD